MNPDTFTPFSEAEPEKHRLVIVTNNLNSKNAYGEMSHAWLTGHVQKEGDIFITYTDNWNKIQYLTHWKYA